MARPPSRASGPSRSMSSSPIWPCPASRVGRSPGPSRRPPPRCRSSSSPASGATGGGGAFGGGGEGKSLAQNLGGLGPWTKENMTYRRGAAPRLCRSDKPVTMAVNGVAAGGGFSFALSGDLVIAAESARFTMAYSKIAATPDGSSSYFLPRLVGLRRAMELYFTNRVLSAREALEWGLVTRVVPDAELANAVHALARELAQGPSKAFGGAKRLFHHSTWESLETQMELEAQAIAVSGRTEDFKGGVTAFANKN